MEVHFIRCNFWCSRAQSVKVELQWIIWPCRCHWTLFVAFASINVRWLSFWKSLLSEIKLIVRVPVQKTLKWKQCREIFWHQLKWLSASLWNNLWCPEHVVYVFQNHLKGINKAHVVVITATITMWQFLNIVCFQGAESVSQIPYSSCSRTSPNSHPQAKEARGQILHSN